ncbi:MAG: hypothetical protein ACT4NV_16575 [Rhodoferax sp.]
MRIRLSPFAWAVLVTVGAAALGVQLGSSATDASVPTQVSVGPVAAVAAGTALQPVQASAVADPAAQPGACGGSAQANPFAAQAQCANAARAPAPLPGNLSEVQQALDSVDPCAGQGGACRRGAHPFEATLVRQLETLALDQGPSARVALALQLQRQRAREGLQLQDAAHVAQDADLQRAVALLAEAAAVGDPQALRYREALGAEGARLLHTGR